MAAVTSSNAQAHWYRTPGQIKKIKSTEWKIKAYKWNILHANLAIHFARTHRRLLSVKSGRRYLQAHRYVLHYSTNKIRQLEWSGLPAHYTGWHCITYGAYPGAAHEGHGYNGPYTGPLQMTSPWMGHSAPNGDWNTLSDTQVYWVAERVAAAYGFSYSFMAGQWPNTFPPCSRYF